MLSGMVNLTSCTNWYQSMSHNRRSRTTSVREPDIIILSYATAKHSQNSVHEGLTNLTITRPKDSE